MSDEVVMKELVAVLTDIRHELRYMRGEGMVKPLAHYKCMRCKKQLPCEQIEGRSICLDCLAVIVISLEYQRTTGLAKAVAAGQTEMLFKFPLATEEMLNENAAVGEASSEMLASEGT